jgi:3-dehydroquinate synthase
MDVIQQEFGVWFKYPVHFTRNVFARTNPLLRALARSAVAGQPARILFVLDEGVSRAHPELRAGIEGYCAAHADGLELAGPILVLPGGERVKNDPRHTADVTQAIHDAALCRHSYLAAVGGGAMLDVAGYAAATAHRGIRLIRIPTTVLAQDDSAVGVKNGINGFGLKNYLGTFAPPYAVVNDFSFLTTLSDADWLGGLSEAIKVALIRDRGFFEHIERDAAALVNRDMAAMERVVRQSAVLHLAHIANGGDPFETGSSRPLDFGHWAAHKLERLTGYHLGHGAAVAIGIALDTTYSHAAGYLPEAQWRRILDVFRSLRLAVYAPELRQHLDDPAHPSSLLRGLDEFREHLGGRLTIMVLRGIGDAFNVHEIRHDLVARSVDLLERFAPGSTRPEGSSS